MYRKLFTLVQYCNKLSEMIVLDLSPRPIIKALLEEVHRWLEK